MICLLLKRKNWGEFISTISDNVIYNSRKILNGKELDAYLPNNGLAIEFNGLYWHSDVFRENHIIMIKLYHVMI